MRKEYWIVCIILVLTFNRIGCCESKAQNRNPDTDYYILLTSPMINQNDMDSGFEKRVGIAAIGISKEELFSSEIPYSSWVVPCYDDGNRTFVVTRQSMFDEFYYGEFHTGFANVVVFDVGIVKGDNHYFEFKYAGEMQLQVSPLKVFSVSQDLKTCVYLCCGASDHGTLEYHLVKENETNRTICQRWSIDYYIERVSVAVSSGGYIAWSDLDFSSEMTETRISSWQKGEVLSLQKSEYDIWTRDLCWLNRNTLLYFEDHTDYNDQDKGNDLQLILRCWNVETNETYALFTDNNDCIVYQNVPETVCFSNAKKLLVAYYKPDDVRRYGMITVSNLNTGTVVQILPELTEIPKRRGETIYTFGTDVGGMLSLDRSEYQKIELSLVH